MNANRQDWEWQFTAGRLLAACNEKMAYHEQRAREWGAKRIELEAQLRESGVQFREMPITGGNRVDAVIDPHLQQTLNEATSKCREHGDKVKEYERYRRAFENNSGLTYSLKLDDIAFFGL